MEEPGVYPTGPIAKRLAMGLLSAGWLVCVACAAVDDRRAARNSLHQETSSEGSTVPKARPPYYPNTSGNIVSPPGNPAGNPAGSPPIVGGTMNQETGWPDGR